MAKLSYKQKCFVDEYLVDLNATQAAIRAGYSPQTARQIGEENLSKLYIKAEIDKAMAKRSKRTGINQDRVIEELAKIAFADMRNFADWGPKGVTLKDSTTLSQADTACVLEVSESSGKVVRRTIKLHDKKGALELLGKHLGMFTEKLDVTVHDDITERINKGRERARQAILDAL